MEKIIGTIEPSHWLKEYISKTPPEKKKPRIRIVRGSEKVRQISPVRPQSSSQRLLPVRHQRSLSPAPHIRPKAKSWWETIVGHFERLEQKTRSTVDNLIRKAVNRKEDKDNKAKHDFRGPDGTHISGKCGQCIVINKKVDSVKRIARGGIMVLAISSTIAGVFIPFTLSALPFLLTLYNNI